MMIDLRGIQREQEEWALRNFGNVPSYQPLLGAVEELGELAHAHLKHIQGIRGFDQDAAAKDAKIDAVADIIIYLLDYCNREGIDIESAVADTWDKVKQRNWKDNPEGVGV